MRAEFTCSVASPIGELLLTGTERGLSGLWMEDRVHPPEERDRNSDTRRFEDVIRQIDEYFAGTRTDFDVALDPAGTDFQQRVWQELRKIPYGVTVSYLDIARQIGNPNAVRAVGAANGRNPVSIIVPCHRVIGSNGSLTGYGGGIHRKVLLLEHEARFAAKQRKLSF